MGDVIKVDFSSENKGGDRSGKIISSDGSAGEEQGKEKSSESLRSYFTNTLLKHRETFRSLAKKAGVQGNWPLDRGGEIFFQGGEEEDVRNAGKVAFDFDSSQDDIIIQRMNAVLSRIEGKNTGRIVQELEKREILYMVKLYKAIEERFVMTNGEKIFE